MLNICSNPMVSLPDQAAIRKALETLELYVVIDFFMSESAELADIVLPGSVWAEDEGTTTNVEGRVIRINKAANPPGEARVDWEIICDLARALRPGRQVRLPLGGRDLGRAARGLEGRQGRLLRHHLREDRRAAGRLLALPHAGEQGHAAPVRGDASTSPTARPASTPSHYQPPAELPDAEYPFFYTTGRLIFHYLSGNQTRRIGALVENAPEPYVEIHPLAAEKLGVDSGDLVRVRSRRGEMIVPAKVTRAIRPDTVFIPYHWGGKQAANHAHHPRLRPDQPHPGVQGLRGHSWSARPTAPTVTRDAMREMPLPRPGHARASSSPET